MADTLLDAWIPRYHITGERNWINDPNGPIESGGAYHLFYQAYPDAPRWGPPSWGHVRSTDLVRWQREPVALAPGPAGSVDDGGCWSGCCRVIGGRPTIFYTAAHAPGEHREESVCRAWPTPDLVRWETDPGGPVVPSIPLGGGHGSHRDPFLWEDEGGWHMLIGSGTLSGERHGQILRYDSPNGEDWHPGGIFFDGLRTLDGVDLGEHWECPQLVTDGDRVALIISCATESGGPPLMYTVQFTGTITGGRFDGTLRGRIDHGDSYYAPALCRDAQGRWLIWGWHPEAPDLATTPARVGALSLPRVLRFDGDAVAVAPAPELDALRDAPLELGAALPPQAELLIRSGNAARCELGTPGEPGHTVIDSAPGAGCVEVSVDGGAPLRAPLGHRVEHELRLFLDGSLVELFVDGTSALSTRRYPSRPETAVTLTGGDWQGWVLPTDAISPP